MDGARGPASRAKRATGSAGEQASLARALAPLKEFQRGLQLGSGYELGPQISSGAEGDVFAAAESASGARVAIKRVRVSSPAIQRHVQQELSAVFRARAKHAEEVGDPHSPGHPCIVGYLDWFAGPAGLEREVCLVMQRCDFCISDMIFGVSQVRAQYEKRHKSSALDPCLHRFTEGEIVRVMHQVLLALDFLNRLGICHRDVKSENILWLAGKPLGSYKLADFGTAACQAANEPCKRADDCGTLWTMAPELLGRRSYFVNCDVWSLGVTLVEMASLDKPFNSKELLAYRNLFESSLEGSFWPAMLQAQGAGALGAPGAGRPRPAGAGAGAGAGGPGAPAAGPGGAGARPANRGLDRPLSAAALPAVKSQRRRLHCHSPPAQQRRAKSGALPPLRPEAPAAAPSSPSSPSSPGAGGACGGPSPGGSPGGSPGAGGPGAGAEAARAKKHAFLRKRCGHRWCYSEGLTKVLLDLMLEEDTAARATAAGLLGSQQVQDLLAFNGLGPPATPGAAGAAATTSSATAENSEPAPCPEKSIQQLLTHATAELFFKALLAEQDRLKAAAERAEQRRASPRDDR